MKNIKYFIFIALICGCANNTERFVFVDNNGNQVQVHRMVPKFNEEQLQKQKNLSNNYEANNFKQMYNNSQQKSNFAPINVQSNDENIIIAHNNKYPNDIFSDRITNYNYINTSNNQKDINTKPSSNKLDTNRTNNKDNKDNKENKNNKSNDNKKNTIISDKNKNNKKYVLMIDDKNIKNNIQNKNIQTNTKSLSNSTLQKNTSVQQKDIDLAKQDTNVVITTNKTTKKIDKGYYIQIGIYSNKDNANKSYNKYKTIKSGVIEEYSSETSVKYRVLLGPYSKKDSAEKDLERVIKTGHYDVYITEKK